MKWNNRNISRKKYKKISKLTNAYDSRQLAQKKIPGTGKPIIRMMSIMKRLKIS